MVQSSGEAQTFVVVRPLCVTLLRHTTAPKLGNEIISTLQELLRVLGDVQRHGTLAPPLIHYIFYPLSQLLRREEGIKALPDRIRELTFKLLECLTKDWWQAWTASKLQASSSASLQEVSAWQIWEQLLLLGVMALSEHVRGSESCTLAISRFLIQLLQPRNEAAQTGQYEWDGESDLPSLDTVDESNGVSCFQIYPSDGHTRAARDDRACVGALSHIIKLALDMSLDSTHPNSLRCEMVKLASVASMTWLVGDRYLLVHDAQFSVSNALTCYKTASEEKDICATRASPIIPGIISSMIKLVGGRVQATGELVSHAYKLLASVLVVCVSDVVTAPLRSPTDRPTLRLEDFAQDFHEESVLSDTDTDLAFESETPATSIADTDSGLRNAAWFERTMHAVLLALLSLDVNQSRDYAAAEHAMIDCLLCVLQLMPETISAAWHDAMGDSSAQSPLCRLLSHLLDLGSRNRRSSVQTHALESIQTLFLDHPELWLERLGNVMDVALSLLPGAIRGVHDEQVVRNALRIETAATLCGSTLASCQLEYTRVGFLSHFRTHAQVESWGDTLMAALSAFDAMTFDDVSSLDGLLLRPHCPPLEPGSLAAIGAMFRACGRTVASLLVQIARPNSTPLPYSKAFASLMYFVQEGCHCRTRSKRQAVSQRRSVACLFAANEQLAAIAELIATPEHEAFLMRNEGRPLRKPVHALAKTITQLVLDAWNEDREEELYAAISEPKVEETAIVQPVEDTAELTRGLQLDNMEIDQSPGLQLKAGKALNTDFVDSARLGQISKVRHDTQLQRKAGLAAMSDALLLSILASCASLLGPQFRSCLLHTLYPLLSALASPSEDLARSAQCALDQIARACAYANAESCVMHHADYVLGAASHRLVVGLSAELRAGLTQMQLADAMHNTAKQIRAQGSLLGARTAPWVLVQVLEMLGVDALPKVEDAVEEVLDALDRFHGYDEICDGLLAVLARMLHLVASHQKQDGNSKATKEQLTNDKDPVTRFREWFISRDPIQSEEAFGLPAEDDLSSKSAAAPESANDAMNEDVDSPATRLQSIVTQIVSRSVPFLSHASALIRMRALQVLADSVRVLGPEQRTAELYPVLHRAWPLIMARLGTNTTRRTDPHFVSTGRDRAQQMLPSEQDSRVWINATQLVGLVGGAAPEVFGKMIVEQAWPRWKRLLDVLEHPIERKQTSLPVQMASENQHDLISTANSCFRIYDQHSTLGNVLLEVMRSLQQVINARQSHFPTETLFAIATYPTFQNTLDARQCTLFGRVGVSLYRTLRQVNEPLAWVVLRAVTSDCPPDYLRRNDLQITSLASIW
ncbi:hypothetical protein MPSI1_001149 [Malassezia psittaci]|uniref:TTI1 C-terminal TPR domain-containing protein n=1 Tax=Malassezia psittaci TaxID=1821823 RepID=A0AAF0F8V7_9BASI|nr:hypothetical protein MPSI1_001149 [Malassezia psittaci]